MAKNYRLMRALFLYICMPWKIVENHSDCLTSKPFAVIKVSDGKKAGCHTSRKKANAQLAALNASENKTLNMANLKEFPMNDAVPSTPLTPESAGLAATIKSVVIPNTPDTPSTPDPVEKSSHDPINWLPFGVTSFEQLEQFESARSAAFEIAEKSHLFPQMVENIMADDEIVDKSAAVSRISAEFALFVNEKTSKIGEDDEKSISEKAADLISNSNGNGGLLVWKQDDTHRWLAIYSNNYRDREVEIISSKSHERFVDMVDSGQFPMPVLRHFHVEGTDWGQAEMVHYDKETGFALAAGYVLPGHEHEAKAIMAMDSVPAMSHGMLKSNLRRDPADSNIIIEHQTIELSDLPFEDAANQLLTNFHIIKEADTMGLTQKKKDYLKTVGVKDVDGLEKSLLAGKTLAENLNLDSKETEVPTTPVETPVVASVVAPVELVDPVVVAPAPTEPVPAVATPVEPAPVATPEPTETPAVEGFNETQTKQLVEVFSSMLDTIEKKIDEKLAPITKTTDAIISNEDELLQKTPLGSFNDLILSKKYLENQSALTAPENIVDGRTRLSKDGPAEADPVPQITASGNGLVDTLAANIVDGSWKDSLTE